MRFSMMDSRYLRLAAGIILWAVPMMAWLCCLARLVLLPVLLAADANQSAAQRLASNLALLTALLVFSFQTAVCPAWLRWPGWRSFTPAAVALIFPWQPNTPYANFVILSCATACSWTRRADYRYAGWPIISNGSNQGVRRAAAFWFGGWVLACFVQPGALSPARALRLVYRWPLSLTLVGYALLPLSIVFAIMATALGYRTCSSAHAGLFGMTPCWPCLLWSVSFYQGIL